MTPQEVAEQIMAGAARMQVDLRSTLDLTDEVLLALTALAGAERGDLTDYRDATEQEVAGWLAGYVMIPGAIETEHGLLVPSQVPSQTPTACPTSPSRLHVFHGRRSCLYCGLTPTTPSG